MKAGNCLSPTKENFDNDSSPSRHAQSQGDIIRQLIGVINSKGLTLPRHVDKKYKAAEFCPLKLKSAMSSGPPMQDELKKVRAKLMDVEFQKKKLEEDFAQYKLASRQEKAKDVKKWENSVEQLKQTMENTSESSNYKLETFRQSSEKELSEVKQKYEALMAQEKQNLISSYQGKIQSLYKLHERDLKEQIEMRQKKIANQQIAAHRRCQQIEQKKTAEIKAVKEKHKSILQAKQKKLEGRITAAICQKRTEQKLHQKTKLQYNQTKQKLLNELYYEKKARNQVEEELANRCNEIKQLKRKIADFEVIVQLNNEKAERKLNEVKQHFTRQIQAIQDSQIGLIKQLNNQFNASLQQYQGKLEQMVLTHEQKEQIWNRQMAALAVEFEARPSKKEDLQAIEKLKARLQKKEEEVKSVNKELKHCMLELENKQDTYNRIFTSASRGERLSSFEHKKTLVKEDRMSRQNLYRRSQTTDFHLLLKVCNKQL